MFKKGVLFFISIFLLSMSWLVPSALAFSTFMSGSFALGQTDLNSFTPGVSGTALNYPSSISTDGKRFFVTDTANNRILIYKNIPTGNNQGADVVVGQNTFNTGSPGSLACGFNFINIPDIQYIEGAATSDGTHLFVADSNNNRVLIYNSIPTSNGACPNVVVGQNSLGTNSVATSSAGLNAPTRVFTNKNKLFVVDQINSRILIWNSIPASNGVKADVVLGKSSFTDNTGGVSQNLFDNPHAASTDGTHLFVADTENHRVLIYNSIPTTNGAKADVVLGQNDFVSNQTNPNGITANSVGYPEDVFSDGKKLVVSDQQNNRVLIWNSIPTNNNQAADIAVGQANFGSDPPNTTGINADGLNTPSGVTLINNQLFVADTLNHRVVMYQNILNSPLTEIDNVVGDGANGKSRMKGNAFANDDNYTISNVSYSVNGGPASNASFINTSPDESFTGYQFDFDQKTNNNIQDGFTVTVNATNSNSDVSDPIFYFQPFKANGPSDNVAVDTPLPTFDFSVNKQTQIMANNIEGYQIQVKQDAGEWMTYLDSIPPDFLKSRNISDKLRAVPDGDVANDNGTFENKDFIVQYSENSSRIQVHAKDSGTDFFAGGKELHGTLLWKATAIDKQGHYQETSPQTLRYGSTEKITHNDRFPLVVASITGVNSPLLSSQSETKLSFKTKSLRPKFFGITNALALVTMKLKEVGCTASVTHICDYTFKTNATLTSRFGINLPTLKNKTTYKVRITAQRDGDYVEIPEFEMNVKK